MENNSCTWAKTEKEILYHNTEWCVPTYDDQIIFEFLVLEGMQAGLSWSTVLNKREHMRKAFANFDPHKIVEFTENDIENLINNKDIIRNKLKIKSVISNAKLFIDIQEKHGSFSDFIWSYVDFTPIDNKVLNTSNMPITHPVSDKISRDLKKLGFKFVGEKICYSFMQGIGMVNDHLVTCSCYDKIKKSFQ